MKKVLVGFAVVIVLIVAAAIAIPFLVPLETYKEEIAGQVRNATGRELTIKGDIKFSLLRRLNSRSTTSPSRMRPGQARRKWRSSRSCSFGSSRCRCFRVRW